ncbi:choice-of-anchor Q domain-containing protein [Candidatus Villigracilis saccharophilus]|uniref:choice-of-anchor Q domain-containing protein n=1 Tax=Candidatus Villigracilis saccharophilus TaxID=3140684 RepID=UPI0031E74167
MGDSLNGDDCVNSGGGTVTAKNNLIEAVGAFSNACGLTNGVNGNIIGSDPLLGPLANNGGPTQTMALLSGSPAINAGDDADCEATDQRGVTRPQGSHCDIGAYEANGGGDTTGVFRPGNGLLYLKNANTTGFADVAINYGLGGDYPIAGDWDGNGTATIGIYRNGSFYLRNSNTVGFADLVIPFGTPGDQPLVGDWNGDGVDTIGVYSNGQFLLRNSNSAGTADMSFYLGNPGDVGIAGDWNGDGLDTTGVFRPSNGVIFLKNLNTTGFADIAINYGLAGDKPVTGDWNNDGIDTIGVYRNAQFLLRNSNTIGFAEIVFGLGNPGDMPIAGNWDGIP